MATTSCKGGVYTDAARRVLAGRMEEEKEKVWLMSVLCMGPVTQTACRDVEELTKITASVVISTPTTPPNYPLLIRSLRAIGMAVRFLRVHNKERLSTVVRELFEQRRFVESVTSAMTFAVTTGVEGWERMRGGEREDGNNQGVWGNKVRPLPPPTTYLPLGVLGSSNPVTVEDAQRLVKEAMKTVVVMDDAWHVMNLVGGSRPGCEGEASYPYSSNPLLPR